MGTTEKKLTNVQEKMLQNLIAANFCTETAYRMATNCGKGTAHCQGSKLLTQRPHIRTAILSLIEDVIGNLQPSKKAAANKLHARILNIELREK